MEARLAGADEVRPSKRGPAGVVVLAQLRDQVGTLKAFDPAVRRDQPDAVHRMRVSTRRLRSLLATFERLLAPGTTDDLRAELAWLAGVLGDARDAEVMLGRLTGLASGDAAEVDEDPGGDTGADTGGDTGGDTGAVGDLGTELEDRYRAAHRAALRALDSGRYFRLLDSLDALLASPPWTGTAEEPARAVLPGLVRRDWRRVKKRAAAAAAASSPTEQDVELHELRKAAKRLRYSCEALAPVFGDHAEELGSRAKQLQDVLGDHQDSVVSRELLHQLAAQAELRRESVLVLGRLQVLEEQHAERSRTQYEGAFAQVAEKRHRRWLTA